MFVLTLMMTCDEAPEQVLVDVLVVLTAPGLVPMTSPQVTVGGGQDKAGQSIGVEQAGWGVARKRQPHPIAHVAVPIVTALLARVIAFPSRNQLTECCTHPWTCGVYSDGG
jgi:hypothetical protein